VPIWHQPRDAVTHEVEAETANGRVRGGSCRGKHALQQKTPRSAFLHKGLPQQVLSGLPMAYTAWIARALERSNTGESFSFLGLCNAAKSDRESMQCFPTEGLQLDDLYVLRALGIAM